MEPHLPGRLTFVFLRDLIKGSLSRRSPGGASNLFGSFSLLLVISFLSLGL